MIRCAICTHAQAEHEPDSFTGTAPCEGVFFGRTDNYAGWYPCGCQDFLDERLNSVVPELEGLA